MTLKTNQDAIRLSAAEAERQVIITPEDQDRFVLTCDQAIAACKIHSSRKVWFEELGRLFFHVNHWAIQHQDRVLACYAAPRGGQVVVFVIPKSDHFSFDLADLVVDLDIEITQKFQSIPAEVLQIPGASNSQFNSFVDPKIAKHLYGPDIVTQGAVAP